MTPHASAPTTRGRLLVGAAIVLLALNLRVAVGSLGVVLGPVRDDLGISTAVGGILTTVPVICFAVFGVGAHGVVTRLGLHRTAALVLAMITVGLVARAVVDTTALFLVCTVIALAGAAMGNIILPPLVKVHFPDRLALRERALRRCPHDRGDPRLDLDRAAVRRARGLARRPGHLGGSLVHRLDPVARVPAARRAHRPDDGGPAGHPGRRTLTAGLGHGAAVRLPVGRRLRPVRLVPRDVDRRGLE